MLVDLGHAVDVRLVQRVDFVVVVSLLGQGPAIESEIALVLLQGHRREFSSEFPRQAPGDGSQLARGPLRLLHRAPVDASPLGQKTFSHLLSKSPPQLDLLFCPAPNAFASLTLRYGLTARRCHSH